MVDLTLSEEQLALQRTARDFARSEIAPLVSDRKSGAAPADLDKRTLGVFRRGVALGFTRLMIPEQYGGLGGSCMDHVIIAEELAMGDISVAADLFNLATTMPQLFLTAGDEALAARWLSHLAGDGGYILAGCLSEPNIAGSELFCPDPDPKFGIRTHAQRDGDHYIINGNKSAFITNAGVADYYFVMARTDLNQALRESISIFLVPRDTPGLHIGKRTELIGWHLSRHAEVTLENLRVPAANRLGAEGAGGAIFAQAPAMAVGLAACFVGLARSAYEYALAYAQERRSCGKALIEHQAVALKLADMAVDLQAARLMVWDAALASDSDPVTACTTKGPAAKTIAVDTAIRNAQRATEILGAYGVTAEYSTGDMLNDAWVGYACDFTRDMLRLSIVPFLAPQN
ncbi:MAG: acyl-CoA dehydrogenase family protein [Halioglobus sp.]|nr:acyl-CoA dehydrogenase family protein [Halioglobus sp.]